MGGVRINADPDIIAKMDVKYELRGECEFQYADFCEQIFEDKNPSLMPGLIMTDYGL